MRIATMTRRTSIVPMRAASVAGRVSTITTRFAMLATEARGGDKSGYDNVTQRTVDALRARSLIGKVSCRCGAAHYYTTPLGRDAMHIVDAIRALEGGGSSRAPLALASVARACPVLGPRRAYAMKGGRSWK